MSVGGVLEAWAEFTAVRQPEAELLLSGREGPGDDKEHNCRC